jgi:uncharacterized protein YjiS (DUF1127 family)
MQYLRASAPEHLACQAPDATATETWLARWWQVLLQKQRERRTMRALDALSDRTLKDIGIDRSEIESVARSVGADRYLHGQRDTPKRCR